MLTVGIVGNFHSFIVPFAYKPLRFGSSDTTFIQMQTLKSFTDSKSRCILYLLLSMLLAKKDFLPMTDFAAIGCIDITKKKRIRMQSGRVIENL